MPLYKPKFLTPNALTDDSVVDLEAQFNPTCVIDGDIPITAYQININRLGSETCLGYDCNVVHVDNFTIYNLNSRWYKFTLESSIVEDTNVYVLCGGIWYEATRINENTYHTYLSAIGSFPETLEVTVNYISMQDRYSTGKTPLSQPFYCVNSDGKYNIFKPNPIDLMETKTKYIIEKNPEIVTSNQIYLEYPISSSSIEDFWLLVDDGTRYGNWRLRETYSDITINSCEYSSAKNKYLVTFSENVAWLGGKNISFVKYETEDVQAPPYTYEMCFWGADNSSETPSVVSDTTVFYADKMPDVEFKMDDSSGETLGSDITINSKDLKIYVDYQDSYSNIKFY